jgi:hypothetical protein
MKLVLGVFYFGRGWILRHKPVHAPPLERQCCRRSNAAERRCEKCHLKDHFKPRWEDHRRYSRQQLRYVSPTAPERPSDYDVTRFMKGDATRGVFKEIGIRLALAHPCTLVLSLFCRALARPDIASFW